MAELQYKCPCCGGALEFNSGVQKMKCPFCDTEFEMEALKSLDEALSNVEPDDYTWDTTAGSEWNDAEADGIRSYVCKSCGGEVIGDSNTAATECPYCGNPIVMMDQFKGVLKPDYVIPFKLDKNAAKKKFEEHLKGKKLLPKAFTQGNHIEEIKGIYVPYWLFDADASAHIQYEADKIKEWEDADHRYKRTDTYSVLRSGLIAFDNVPVDGSSKMADDLMESLEPYSMRDAVPFQTAYLAGYVADKYDVDDKASVARANERVKNSTEAAFRKTVTGYDTVDQIKSNIRLSNGTAKYALYPVWILNTTWNGQKFVFAMNGQTGKFVGNLPMDKSLFSSYLFKTAGIAAVVAFVIQLLFGLM